MNRKISGPTETIQHCFLAAANRYPDNAAFNIFSDGWKTISYHNFSRSVSAIASHLINAGLNKGDCAAIISENRPEWCSAYLAIVMAGGIAVPLDIQLGPEEVKNLLTDASVSFLFHSDKTSDLLNAYREQAPVSLKHPLYPINFDSMEYASALETAPCDDFPAYDPESLASIIYTSGTTGKPKGVMLTHSNFCSDAIALIDADIVSHEDNVLSILPLHHTYAFMCTFLVPISLGATITYPASLKGPDLVAAIRDKGVSILIGVPQVLGIIRNGILNKIAAMPKPVSFILRKLLGFSGFLRRNYDINIGKMIFNSAHKALGWQFRFFGSGGAKLDPEIMKDLEALGFTVLEGYGLTETSPVVTFNPLSNNKLGSAGKPLPSAEIKIQNPSESGEGEILIKGPMVMKGYYKNPSATSDVMTGEWFRTGDIGRIDQDGYLFITGRLKEVIVLSSGKNIYPEELERIYLASKLIREVCIVGIEDKGSAESLHAVIVPDFEYAKQAGISNIPEMIRWEINDIAPKIPSYMRISGYSIQKDPLPKTPLGKLRRFMIKADLTSGSVAKKRPSQEETAPSDQTSMKVFAALRNYLNPGQHIRLSDHLELDIGLDSLSKIELSVALENAFSVKLPENFFLDINSVQDLVEKIRMQTTEVAHFRSDVTGWRNILLIEPDIKVKIEKPESMMLPVRMAFGLVKLFFRAAFSIEAKGVENIPLDRNFIITPNHTSYLDGFVSILCLPFSYFKRIYSLGLSDFFEGPIKSRLAKAAHVIPIDSLSYLNKALQMSAYVLRNNRSLCVFPEGGRSPDGNLIEFKKGVGILAVEMDVPVIPTLIEGAFEAWPRNTEWPKFCKITVKFGRPLYASTIDYSKKPEGIDNYQYFANVLREKVMELKH